MPPYFFFFREQILFFVIVQTLTVTNKKRKKNKIWCNLSKVNHRTHISVTIFFYYINIDRRINEQTVTSGVKSLLPPRHLQY